MTQRGTVEHLNPEKLHHHPSFTNVVTVSGPTKTVYVGGQNAVTAAGETVGKGDLAAQVEQVFSNLEEALAAAGATLDHVVKWNIYVAKDQPLEPGFEVFQPVWGRRPNPPLITLARVEGFGDPDWLVELDAVAVVPQ